jgi:hypothetical protein
VGSRESKKEFSRKFISRRFDPHHYDDLKGAANNYIRAAKAVGSESWTEADRSRTVGTVSLLPEAESAKNDFLSRTTIAVAPAPRPPAHCDHAA